MIFSSFDFLVFFSVLSAAYCCIRGRVSRQWLLLAASLVFYGWWDVRFLALIGGVVAVTYGSARLFDLYPEYKKKVLAGGIAVLLGVLGLFKYFNFFLGNLNALLSRLGFETVHPFANILLPVGISFYTFQGISYMVDVYRGHLSAEHSLRKVALYITFFPQLVAGPIVRSTDFIPQLENKVHVTIQDLGQGMKLFLIGFIYKSLFADSLSEYIDTVFADMALYSNRSIRIAVLGFYSQIYFDFAGYSIMAIGIARMLGYRLGANFDFPYLATSITEFWKRWHISLSRWLRDYLYIPLGGNRHGFATQNRNLLLTMLLGGLWHGASWNFVIWGGLHGTALVVHKIMLRRRKQILPENHDTPWSRLWIYPVVAWMGTQCFVLLCWVPFRLPHLDDTLSAFSALFGWRDDTGLKQIDMPLMMLLPVWIDAFLIGKRERYARWIGQNSVYWRFAMLGVILALLLFALPLKVKNFIYFQF